MLTIKIEAGEGIERLMGQEAPSIYLSHFLTVHFVNLHFQSFHASSRHLSKTRIKSTDEHFLSLLVLVFHISALCCLLEYAGSSLVRYFCRSLRSTTIALIHAHVHEALYRYPQPYAFHPKPLDLQPIEYTFMD